MGKRALFTWEPRECPYPPADSPSSFISALRPSECPAALTNRTRTDSAEACVLAIAEGGFSYVLSYIISPLPYALDPEKIFKCD